MKNNHSLNGRATVWRCAVGVRGKCYSVLARRVPWKTAAHPVQLESFGLDKREVTVGDYAKYVTARNVSAPQTTRPDDAMPVTVCASRKQPITARGAILPEDVCRPKRSGRRPRAKRRPPECARDDYGVFVSMSILPTITRLSVCGVEMVSGR